MENLAPPLDLLLNIKMKLSNGESLRMALQNYLSEENEAFRKTTTSWLYFKTHNDLEAIRIYQSIKSPYRKILLDILWTGLQGNSILIRLEELEKDLVQACKMEIEKKIQVLPIKVLIPLLLFQFPAFLILLLGPIFRNFLEGLSF